jgi:hypothetical protein
MKCKYVVGSVCNVVIPVSLYLYIIDWELGNLEIRGDSCDGWSRW